MADEESERITSATSHKSKNGKIKGPPRDTHPKNNGTRHRVYYIEENDASKDQLGITEPPLPQDDDSSSVTSLFDSNILTLPDEPKRENLPKPQGNVKLEPIPDALKSSVFYIGGDDDAQEGRKTSVQSIYENRKEIRRKSIAAPPSPSKRRWNRIQSSILQKKNSKDDNERLEFTPPDGGYGWVIVIAACVVQIWIMGFIKSYSVLYVQIIAAFPNSSAYHASWIPALLSTIGLLVGKYTHTNISVTLF